MTITAIPTTQRLTPRELRAWPEPVSTALLAMVNRRGVKFRIIDGGHILLYPPDRDQRAVKFSAHRPAEANLHFLTEFAEKHLGPYVPEPRDDRPATDAELTALTGLNNPERARSPQRTETWQPYLSYQGKPTIFETNGRVYRCTKPGCTWITETGNLGVHAAGHSRRENTDADRVMLPRLRAIREGLNMPRPALGEAIGVSGSAVAIWEKNGHCPSKWVPKIAAALDVRVSDLTDDIIKRKQSQPSPPEVDATPPGHEPDPGPTTQQDPEPTSEPDPAGTSDAAARDALLTIADAALGALGRENIAEELRTTRERLDEVEATLALIREATGLLDV